MTWDSGFRVLQIADVVKSSCNHEYAAKRECRPGIVKAGNQHPSDGRSHDFKSIEVLAAGDVEIKPLLVGKLLRIEPVAGIWDTAIHARHLWRLLSMRFVGIRVFFFKLSHVFLGKRFFACVADNTKVRNEVLEHDESRNQTDGSVVGIELHFVKLGFEKHF